MERCRSCHDSPNRIPQGRVRLVELDFLLQSGSQIGVLLRRCQIESAPGFGRRIPKSPCFRISRRQGGLCLGDATAEPRRALRVATAQKNTDLAARLQRESSSTRRTRPCGVRILVSHGNCDTFPSGFS